RNGDILEEQPDSAKTGRAIKDVEGEAPGWSSKTGKITKRSSRKSLLRKTPSPKIQPDASPAIIDPSQVKGATKAALPAFVEPTLATLMKAPPDGERWIHEIKFD